MDDKKRRFLIELRERILEIKKDSAKEDKDKEIERLQSLTKDDIIHPKKIEPFTKLKPKQDTNLERKQNPEKSDDDELER